MSFVCWPSELPGGLEGLYERVGEQLGDEMIKIDDPGALADTEWELGIFVVSSREPEMLDGIARLLRGVSDEMTRRVVLVGGDGVLGTDASSVDLAIESAKALAIVRSIAVRRDERYRANMVCVPDALFGVESSLRGPMKEPVDVIDVVNAVAFLLSSDASYMNGQLLFVDAGRHLFSSLTA